MQNFIELTAAGSRVIMPTSFDDTGKNTAVASAGSNDDLYPYYNCNKT